MEYLLVMMISGSTMTAASWILRRLLRDRISAKLYYLLAKASVLYYLIPLPFLKKWYEEVIHIIVPEGQRESVEMEIAKVSLRWTNYVVRADGKAYVNSFMQIQMAAVIIWVSVACLLMINRMADYVKKARRIAGYVDTKMEERHEAVLADLKSRYGIKRRVLLYQGENGKPSLTFGVFRPVILCGRDIESREGELVLCHELVHIRRLDAVWKMIVQFMKYLCWWNPIVWLLHDEFNRVCEISCDEAAILGRSEEERRLYSLLLIEEAQEKEKKKKPRSLSLGWEIGFGSEMRRVKERMDNLMRNRRWNRFAAGTLVAALILANSMTVLAYRDGVNEIVPEGIPQETIDKVLESDAVVFTPEEVVGEAFSEFDEQATDVILYDRQFTDEEGNIYMIPDVEPHWSCDHSYVSGVETRHNSNSDGSCEVSKYKAERCSKCGTLKMGDWISTTTYAVCPH